MEKNTVRLYESAYIKQVLNDLGLLNSQISEFGEYFRAPAIYRKGDSLSFSIHKRTGVWKDFKTKQWGNLKQLPSLFNGSNVGIKVNDGNIVVTKPQIVKPDKMWDVSVISKLKPHFDFYKKRGISEDILRYFKAGYTDKTDLRGRIVFPIFAPPDGKKINGFSGRDVTGKNPMPWKHLNPSSKFVYPLYVGPLTKQAIEKTGELRLIESIGDLLGLWKRGYYNNLVCFTTSASQAVINTIIMLNPKKIKISFNNEKPKNGERMGEGNKGTFRTLFKLSSFFDLDRIEIDWTSFNSDFGDMTDKQFLEWESVKVDTKKLLLEELKYRKQFGLQPKEQLIYDQL